MLSDQQKPIVVAVKFGFSDKTYDYYSRFAVEVGQKVIVETSRGEATVTVSEIKSSSQRADKFILRVAANGEAK